MLNLDLTTDNLVTWAAMTLASTGALVDNATVSMKLRVASTLATVAGTSAGIALTIASTATCDYQGVLGSTLSLSAGVKYLLDITASTTAGANAFRRIPCRADYHWGTS